MLFKIERGAGGKWFWKLYAKNGEPIANGDQGYHNHADCLHGIYLVQSQSPEAEILLGVHKPPWHHEIPVDCSPLPAPVEGGDPAVEVVDDPSPNVTGDLEAPVKAAYEPLNRD